MTDPRTKLVFILCLTTMAIIFSRPDFLLLVLGVAIGLLFYFHGSFVGLFKRLKGLLVLVVILSLLQSIFNPGGHVLWSLGGLRLITTGGLMAGIAFLCRMLIIVVSGAIVATAGSRLMIQGLVQMKMPYELAFMVSLSLLFLPALKEEMDHSLTAIQLRGIELKKIRWQQRLQLYCYLILPVISRSIDHARHLALSMEMLAFRAYPKRTSYLVLKLKTMDYVWMSAAVALTACAVWFYFSNTIFLCCF